MDNELFWKAVVENDKRFDGIFYTGVLTTKIFCRPSCPARLPKRENVEFFDDISGAEQRGLRACLRCKPKDDYVVDKNVEMAIKVCEVIERLETSDLNTLAAETNLSPSHLQRVFKEVIGVTPKKYAEYKKFDKFKSGVRNGKEIVDAMYDAGFESSSRLYEKTGEKFGMTPAKYKKGGAEMTINYAITETPLGKLLVAATQKGICAVKLGDEAKPLSDELSEEFSNATISNDPSLLKHFVDVIIDALAGKTENPDLPLDLKATSFQMRVWEELRKIPFGETITYSELAKRIGNENSARAVASACAKNNVAIVIPCHRVVGSDGKMRGYRWGVERKRKILENENPAFDSAPRLFR